VPDRADVHMRLGTIKFFLCHLRSPKHSPQRR
jgi:hypothetical protein